MNLNEHTKKENYNMCTLHTDQTCSTLHRREAQRGIQRLYWLRRPKTNSWLLHMQDHEVIPAWKRKETYRRGLQLRTSVAAGPTPGESTRTIYKKTEAPTVTASRTTEFRVNTQCTDCHYTCSRRTSEETWMEATRKWACFGPQSQRTPRCRQPAFIAYPPAAIGCWANR